MTVHQRNIERDTLLLIADILAEGDLTSRRYRVKNLSAGGMMAQGEPPLPDQARVSVKLRNVGAVQGKVVWVEDGRCGIAFDRKIDPQAVRAPTALDDFLHETIRLKTRRN